MNDFSLKSISSQPSLREEIGFITRGGYSQIRGKGIGIGLAKREKIANLYQEQQKCIEEEDKLEAKRFKGKVIMLMRNINSMNYIPVIC